MNLCDSSLKLVVIRISCDLSFKRAACKRFIGLLKSILWMNMFWMTHVFELRPQFENLASGEVGTATERRVSDGKMLGHPAKGG